LGQFHLEFSVAAARALRKDVENQLGAIDGFEAGGIFKGARLSRFQVDIKNGRIGAAAHGGQRDALESSLSDYGARMNFAAGKLQYFGDFHSGCPHRSVISDKALVRVMARIRARSFWFRGRLSMTLENSQCADFFLEIKGQAENIPCFDFSKRFGLMRIAVHDRENVRQFNFPCVPLGFDLDDGNQIQTQQGKIIQVILSNRFSAQVCVDQAKASKSCSSSAKSSNIGEVEVGGISQDYIADGPVARQQNAHLPSEFSGDGCQMLRIPEKQPVGAGRAVETYVPVRSAEIA
jgi:hypothetical protein